eukprot:gene52099-71012_t
MPGSTTVVASICSTMAGPSMRCPTGQATKPPASGIHTSAALEAAEEAGLDLVEIVPNADPPVCKILDYGKFKFQEQKKKNEARKRQKVVEIKEIKLRPNIDVHDYEVKA